MSSTAGSPDGMALNSHYSLRWNNHQAHILQAFEALLEAETLVDVTLVCSDSSLKAHKVVLSACSPFFERIFAEHPCKHPVIVLKDFPVSEVTALIEFMYRGEVRVGREELPGLMRAAESLQVRGLAASQPRPASPPETPTTDLLMGEPSTPEGARQETPEEDDNMSDGPALPSRESSVFPRDPRLPHMTHLNFGLRELRDSCGSPLMPRRKQARPRRRSGELVPQDLSRPHPPASLSPPSTGLNLINNVSHHQQQRQQTPPYMQQQRRPQTPPTVSSQQEEVAENLSIKRSTSPDQPIKTESESASSPRASPLTVSSLHPDSSMQDLPTTGLAAMSALSLQTQQHHSEYLASLGQLAAQWIPSHPQSHHNREGSPHGRPPQIPPPPPAPHSFQHRQSESPLSRRLAPVFSMDGVGPLFPHGGSLDRGSLLADLHDSFKPDALHGLFSSAGLGGNHHPTKKPKKHRSDGDGPRRWNDQGRGLPMGRPKGQHSAPRGGPPRSWTNGELTEALQHVWNKKMTTSQASRVFGIPYNSLLMYVRGKYGKSLKLEQLRRDCTGATTGEVMNSLNNNVKSAVQPPQMSPHPLTGMPHPDDFSHHHLLAGNLPPGFFPDFGASFPVPVNMIHLLPPSEQKNFEAPTSGNGPRSRSPSPMRTNPDLIPSQPPGSAPALLQQNGSD